MACRAYQEYREAIEPTGKKKSVMAAADSWKRFKSMLVEFGLTPAARAKVGVVPEQIRGGIMDLIC